jgi:carbon-monoxide dehydrogenase medium subunit
MKAAAFEYEKPADVATAVRLLAGSGGMGKVMAGGQSLGPMLNLRLAQPQLLVDVRGIEEMRAVSETTDALSIGACVTHAAIEDGRLPDASRGLLPSVAADIAYRAVRNRGTIGGSLAHADPAADWVSTLALLDAVAVLQGPGGRREVRITEFMQGPFATALGEDELLVAVRIARLSPAARWGYYKFCRKTGEFAEAIGAVLVDPERRICRAVIGATNSSPHVVTDARGIAEGFTPDAAMQAVESAGLGEDPYERQMHFVALKRAAARIANQGR